MKYIKLLTITIIIIVTATSCKNDLFKASVKKRLTNEWVLIEGTQGISDTVFPRDEIYTKDSVQITFHDGILKVPYFETLVFNKDFTFISTVGYDFYDGFETTTINGTWELLSAEGEYEDDERIKLTPKTSITGESGDVLPISDAWTYDYIIKIKNLTKDKFEFDYVFAQDDGFEIDKTTGSKKFIKK